MVITYNKNNMVGVRVMHKQIIALALIFQYFPYISPTPQNISGNIKKFKSAVGVSSIFPKCNVFDNYSLAVHSPTAKVMAGKMLCTRTKQYIPSPYEIKQITTVNKLSEITDYHSREEQLMEFVTSRNQIRSAQIWLKRVHERMTSNVSSIIPNEVDFAYLSRFVITENCTNREAKKRVEWIEPLSIHARHPFAFLSCAKFDSPTYSKRLKDLPKENIQNIDYVLLQQKPTMAAMHHPGKKFLFDAGTSYYESSLWWMLCSYFKVEVLSL
jgi:hypothetical protein